MTSAIKISTAFIINTENGTRFGITERGGREGRGRILLFQEFYFVRFKYNASEYK